MNDISRRSKSRIDTIKDKARLISRHENVILLIFLGALIGIISFVTKGAILSRANITNIMLQSSTRGVAAVGQTFVILTAGVDVSVGGVALFCSNLGAILMTSNLELNLAGRPLPLYVVIPLILLVGAGWGAINGSIVSRIGVPPLVVTLGMWQIATGASYRTGTGATVSGLPESLAFLGKGTVGGVPTPVIIFIAVAVIAYFVLHYTGFGRSVYSTGGNPVSAWLSGIRVVRTLFMVYIISGFLAALAAMILTARIMSASMFSAAGLELDTIGAVVVGGVSLFGGRGTIIGAVIGVVIIGIINNAMSVIGAGPAQQNIIKGIIIITAVAVDCIRRR